MRIGIVAPSPVPYVFGGAERLAIGLTRAINERTDHVAELIKIPSPERNAMELLDSYRRFVELDVTGFDLVITSKYPAWMVSHPRHVVYMLHRLRGLYDTYHGPLTTPPVDHRVRQIQRDVRRLSGLPPRELAAVLGELSEVAAERGEVGDVFEFPGPVVRDIVHALDNRAIARGRIERYAAISSTVARRRGYFPAGVRPAVAHPPSDLVPPAGPYEDIVSISRLDGPKRIHLLIEAMAFVRSDVRLFVIGDGARRADLERAAGGDERIDFRGFVTDEVLEAVYRQALVVPFVPEDEDFGLIAMEAGAAGKPVITCTDSGGPRELIRHGATGLIVPPQPAAIGGALDRLARDRSYARRLGEQARERISKITWEHVISEVLGDAAWPRRSQTTARVPPRPRETPRAVVFSTFPVFPRLGGGQVRSFHLYGGLASRFDVTIVSLAPRPLEGAGRVHEFGPRFREVAVAKSSRHHQLENEAAGRAGLPVDDILASALVASTPEFTAVARQAVSGAHVVILSHPFLYSVARDIAPGIPLVYDAHNAEFVLKSALLPMSFARDELLERVRMAEEAACSTAVLTSYCAEGDRAFFASEYGVDEAAMVSVPNGVDLASRTFVSGPERQHRRELWCARLAARTGGATASATFIGSWHAPNNAAGARLVAMFKAMPDIALFLAGSHTHSLPALLPRNVVNFGVVPDTTLRALLHAADVGLNPVEAGGGSNLKMLDYCASGLPVVSTHIGSRGLAFLPERHFVASDLDEFPDAIGGVLANRVAAEERAAAARLLVETEYSWPLLAERLAARILDATDVVPPAPAWVHGGRR